MNLIKDFIKRINWKFIIGLIIFLNIIRLITGDWSVIVIIYSIIAGMIFSILSYIQFKLENSWKKKEGISPNSRNIGVIAYDMNDFLAWREEKKINLVEDKSFLNTTKKFKVDDDFYYRILSVNDLCGLTLHGIIETEQGRNNPHYDKMILIAKINLASSKNLYINS